MSEEGPLSAFEAERAVLSACLLDPDAIRVLAAEIGIDDFVDGKNRVLWEALMHHYDKRERPDALSLSRWLESKGHATAIPYMQEVRQELIKLGETSTEGVAAWAKQLKESTGRRMLDGVADTIRRLARNQGTSVDELHAKALEQVTKIRRIEQQGYRPLSSWVESMMEKAGEWFRGKTVNRLSTGFPSLDKKIGGGLAPGRLYVVGGRPGSMKCIRYDQLVLDAATGERIPVEQFVSERRQSVVSLGRNLLLHAGEVQEWVDSGVQECIEVTFASGRSIVCTSTHPFLTIDGWRPVSELTDGDFAATPRTLPVFGKMDVGQWRARLLGYLIADGDLEAMRFTKVDQEVRADFEKCVLVAFPECIVVWNDSHGTRAPSGKIRSRVRIPHKKSDTWLWVDGLGISGLRAAQKFVPAEVFTWSKECIREFLRGLFTCDGTFAPKGDCGGTVAYSSVSKRLVRDIQHLLLRFGFVGRVKPMGIGWTVNITGNVEIRRFLAEIGFVGPKSRLVCKEVKSNPNVDIVPVGVWKAIDEALVSRGINLSELERARFQVPAGMRRKFNPHRNTRGVSRERLAIYALILDDERLQMLAHSEVFWDRILSIKSVGQARVYDLCVPGDENFVAQDVVVHNTALCLHIAHNVACWLEGHNESGVVAVSTIEMGAEDLLMQMSCRYSKIDSQLLTSGRLKDKPELAHKFMEHAKRISGLPLYLDESDEVTSSMIHYRAALLHSLQGVRLLVIDFAELIGDADEEGEEQRVSWIFRRAKSIAKVLQIPVILISQLSRAAEQGLSKVPSSRHLRFCLSGNVLLTNAESGERISVQDAFESGVLFPLFGMTPDYRLESVMPSAIVDNGLDDVFELTLRSGRRIIATARHRFCSIDGWKRLEDLVVGEAVAVPRVLDVPGSKHIEPDKARLLGYLIGDGELRRTVCWTEPDSVVVADGVDIAERHFDSKWSKTWRGGCWKVYISGKSLVGKDNGRGNALLKWIGDLGLRVLSKERRIPGECFLWDQEAIAGLLAGLFVSDGCVKKSNGQWFVEFDNVSFPLIEDIQHLCLRLGVLASWSKSSRPNPFTSAPFVTWRLSILGREQILRFLGKVKLVGGKAVLTEECVSELEASCSSSNVDLLPREVTEHVFLVKKCSRVELGYKLNSKRSISMDSLLAFADKICDPWLDALAHSDVFWDTVKSIRWHGRERVYDLVVPDLHSFVANDIVVHNSGMGEAVADDVWLTYYPSKYEQSGERVEPPPGMSSDPWKWYLIISKSRFGSVGWAEFKIEPEYTLLTDSQVQVGDVVRNDF